MERILFFDGVCNLCNNTVQWVVRHDPNSSIQFAALQSETAKQKLLPLGINPDALESVVFLEDGKAYTHSDGALRMLKALGGAWAWAYVLRFVPRVIRNVVYNLIAKNRYKLFGKREFCMIPTPDLKKRFLS